MGKVLKMKLGGVNVVVNVDGKVYEVGQELADALVRAAKHSMKGKNAVVAVVKEGKMEMTKYTFDSSLELQVLVHDLRSRGMEVHYVRR